MAFSVPSGQPHWSWRTVYRETASGKSFARTVQNLPCRDVMLEGQGIDLGSGRSRASYHRFFQSTPETLITPMDINPRREGVAAADAEHAVPAEDASQDFVLNFNLLEHLFDYAGCLAECHRVLKPGGLLAGAVPFLVRVHRDPHDFFRYTDEALRRALEGASFREVSVEPLGVEPVIASVSQYLDLIRPSLLRFPILALAVGMDEVLARLSRRNWREAYPLGYFFTATK